MQVGLGLGRVGPVGCGEERVKGEKKNGGNYVLGSRIKISVIMDISVLGFYGYIDT